MRAATAHDRRIARLIRGIPSMPHAKPPRRPSNALRRSIAVALGIASTLAISAVQKTRQIGILKAMGLSDRRAGRIFLWQATLLGVGGSASGVALAYGLLALFALAPTTFTVEPQPLFVLGSFSVGVGVALASSIIPIRGTSKLDPIEVIQNG